MNIKTNYPRVSFEGGFIAYVPLPKNRGMNVFMYRDMYLSSMFRIRSRYWALYDFADYGVKNYPLLVALTNEVGNAAD